MSRIIEGVELGRLCEDTVTGFTGIAVSIHIYFNGSSQVILQPTAIRGSDQGECVLPEARHLK